MSYTLIYTTPPDAEGHTTTTSNTFAGWGISRVWTATFRDANSDELRMKLPGVSIQSSTSTPPYPFAYLGTCIVEDDSGNIIFQGILTTDPRHFSGKEQSIELTWEGPWWYLKTLPYKLPFPQTYDQHGNPVTYQYLTHFALNGSLAFATAQASAILDYAIWKGTNPTTMLAPFQYQQLPHIPANVNTVFSPGPNGQTAYLAANFPNLTVLPEIVLNINCAQALLKQCEDYDAVMFFDHTTTPPTFNFLQRTNSNSNQACLAVTRNLTTGINYDISDVDITRVYDREVPYVFLHYEQVLSVNGQSLTQTFADLYYDGIPNYPLLNPTSTVNVPNTVSPFNGFEATIPLPAISISVQAAYIATVPVIGPGGPVPGTPSGGAGSPAYGPCEDLNFWKAVKPELNSTEFSGVTIVPGSSSRVLSSTNLPSDSPNPNVISDGVFCSWMNGTAVEETFSADFNYTAKNGAVMTTNFSVTKYSTTLAAPGGQTLISVTGGNDLIDGGYYIGMAKQIWTDSNAEAWEGSCKIYNAVWVPGSIAINPSQSPTFVGIGSLLNIGGGFPGWSAMNAPVREIEWTFGGVGVQGKIKVSPPKRLTPKNLMDRMKAWRLKYSSSLSNLSASGNVGSGQIAMPTGNQATTPGATPPIETTSVTGIAGLPSPPATGGIIANAVSPPPGGGGTPPKDNDPDNSYVTSHAVNQSAVAEGVWGQCRSYVGNTHFGFADVGLYLGVVQQLQIPINPSFIGGTGFPLPSDENGWPFIQDQPPIPPATASNGQIIGQILIRASDALGQSLMILPTIGCDANGNKLYCMMLRSAWQTTPIPGAS